MTELTDEAVKALLDRATPGRRVQFHGSYCPEAVGTPFTDWDTSHDMSVIRPDGSRHRLAHYNHASDAYLSQMAPDLARALLDARAERDRLRADAQAAVALVVERAAGIVRSVWGRCEALEDEAADKLANPEKLTDHEKGFWRGQKMVAKSIRRSIEMPLAPADGLAAVEALRKERDAFRRNLRETFEAMCAMRDAINEYIPMPSLESDLLQGPENSVFCATVAQAVIAELAAAKQREARRTFPILKGDGAKIDYQLVADHAEQARSNHGQSVDRLAARGGLSWCELYAVLHNRKWEKVDTNEAMIACRSLEARYLAVLAQTPTDPGEVI